MIAVALADISRLTRRRGLMLSGLLVPIGIVLLVTAVMVILHARDPFEHPAVGGRALLDAVTLISLVTMIFGTLIGAIVGAEDSANGTLRYILLTGFSRLRLFLVRVPVVLVASIAIALPALVLLILAALILPSSGDSIAIGDVLHALLVIAVECGVYALIAYGIGSAFRSVGAAIAIALGLNLIGLNLVSAITLLVPALESWMLPQATQRVLGEGSGSLGVALLALAIWVGAFLALGLFRATRAEA